MKPRAILLVVVVAIVAYLVGAFSARREIFPFPQIKSLWAGVKSTSDPEKPKGAWQVARVKEMPKDLEALKDLPYVGHGPSESSDSGVTAFDPLTTYEGVNFVISGHGPEATLMTMTGDVLHTWRKPLEEVWPGPLGFDEFEPHKTFWRRGHLFPNGDVLAVFEGIGMIKVDKESNLIWENKCRSHHDLVVTDDGTIYTLSRRWLTEDDRIEMLGPMYEDFILMLGPDGKEKGRVSILDSILNSDYRSLLALVKFKGDCLHTNSVEVLDGKHAAKYPMWQKGHVLISIPTMNTVAVIDPVATKMTWAMTGLWKFQHDPKVLEDGRLLVFDNSGGPDGISRIVEVDPLTHEIVWHYVGEEAVPFQSSMLGISHRLPNGNTLIIEGLEGRAFEVRREDRKITWEYYTPHRAGEHDELIASLMDVVRYEVGPLANAFPEIAEAAAQNPNVEKIDTGDLEKLIEKTKGKK